MISQKFKDLMNKKISTSRSYNDSAKHDEWLISLHDVLEQSIEKFTFDTEDGTYSPDHTETKLGREELTFLRNLLSEHTDKRFKEFYDKKLVKDFKEKGDNI